MNRYEIMTGKKEKKTASLIKSSDIIRNLSGQDRYITALEVSDGKYNGVLMFNYGQNSVRPTVRWGELMSDRLVFDSFEEACISLKNKLPKMYSDAKIYYQE